MPIVLAALIMALVGGAGTVYASHDAQPGDALYGVREVVAQVVAANPATHQTVSHDETDKGQANKPDADADDGAQDGPGGKHGFGTHEITPTVQITITNTFSDVVKVADSLPGKSENGLEAKLRAAERSLSKGTDVAAQHQVDAFLHQASAACDSGKLTDAQYGTLYSDYSNLITGIGGQPQASAAPCGTHPESDQDEAAKDKAGENNANQGKHNDDGSQGGQSGDTGEHGKSQESHGNAGVTPGTSSSAHGKSDSAPGHNRR